jgi:hypothetical protein
MTYHQQKWDLKTCLCLPLLLQGLLEFLKVPLALSQLFLELRFVEEEQLHVRDAGLQPRELSP